MSNLNELLPILKTGDIILFYTPFRWYKIRTYLSALIRFFASTKYNHAGVVVNSWGVPMLNEAQAVGIITEPCYTRLKGCYVKVLRRADIDDLNEKDLAKKINSRLGNTKYDFSGTLVHQLVFNISNWLFNNYWWVGKTGEDAAARMYCYEYAGWVHRDLYTEWWKINLAEMRYDSRLKTIFKGKLK